MPLILRRLTFLSLRRPSFADFFVALIQLLFWLVRLKYFLLLAALVSRSVASVLGAVFLVGGGQTQVRDEYVRNWCSELFCR